MSLAYIPSPHSGVVNLGPVGIHMYGVTLLVAIAACVWLTGTRWVRRGGDWDLVFRVAVWGVAFGIVGARAYHDITSYDQDPAIQAHWWGWFAVWKGGLGIWGGVLLGTLAGAWVVRRTGNSIRLFMDAVAPGLLLAQGIGRWGNWWNQELYGKPTNLPWALTIDDQHRPPGDKYFGINHYQPTFLYEFLWDLAMVGVLLWVGRRFRIRPPALFSLYVSLYCFGRFFEELLRIDPAHHFLGLRLNAWVSIVVFIGSTAFFVWWQFIRAPDAEEPQRAKPITPPGPAMAVPRGRVRSGRESPRVVVRELELDLDAFEGPFDLLLTLVLKDELDLYDVDVAQIVLAFIERLEERSAFELDPCGEFLVLVAALLELKARNLFPEEEAELADLEPEEAAEELARRLAEYRRMKEAAAWLRDRLDVERDRYFRLGPAPLAPQPERRLAPQEPALLAEAIRALAAEPPEVSLQHMGLRFPPVEVFLGRFRSLLERRTILDFDSEVHELDRVEQAVAFLALLELRKLGEITLDQAAPFAPIRIKSTVAKQREVAWTARSA